MKKQLNMKLVQYELRNVAGNIFVIFFGIVFPILLSVLISYGTGNQVPESHRSTAITAIFISMSMIIPMSILLIGYAVTYAQELEKGIPLRLNLFGYHEKTILSAKIIANLIFLTGAFIIYVIVDSIILDINVPKLSSVLCLIASLYFLSVIFIVLAHSIAVLLKKFGTTYALTMFLYFGFMILCGMMGISVSQFPSWLQKISKLLPMTYISSDFYTFWQGGKYNFAPFVQSMLFFSAVSFIILLLSIRKDRRVIK